jgi:acetylxylan esterase
MVKFVISDYGTDPAQIVITGSSSGCMMTNVMIALYPDVFAAETCYSSVAAGCLADSPSSSPIFSDPACASGRVNKTGAQWAQIVYNMDPGYKGHRPKFAALHGTADIIVSLSNLDEEIKQWSTVFGINQTASNLNMPQQGYTQLVFGNGTQFVAYSAAGCRTHCPC